MLLAISKDIEFNSQDNTISLQCFHSAASGPYGFRMVPLTNPILVLADKAIRIA